MKVMEIRLKNKYVRLFDDYTQKSIEFQPNRIEGNEEEPIINQFIEPINTPRKER
jgi:hypothetical protein